MFSSAKLQNISSHAYETVTYYGGQIINFATWLLSPVLHPEAFLIGDFREFRKNPSEFKKKLAMDAYKNEDGFAIRSLGVIGNVAHFVPVNQEQYVQIVNELDGRNNGRLALKSFVWFSGGNEIVIADTGESAMLHRRHLSSFLPGQKYVGLVLNITKEILTETKEMPVNETISTVIRGALLQGILGIDHNHLPHNTHPVITRFGTDLRNNINHPLPRFFACQSINRKNRKENISFSQKLLRDQSDQLFEQLKKSNSAQSSLILKTIIEQIKKEHPDNFYEVIQNMTREKFNEHLNDNYVRSLPMILGASINLLDALKVCIEQLCKKPEAITEIRQEMTVEDLFSFQDVIDCNVLMKKLPCLDAWYRESVRFDTPKGVPRYVGNTFKTGNVVIPRNTQLMIDLVSLNKGSGFWSNPNEFTPARFSRPEKEKQQHTLHQYPYIPFSVGKRRCPASDASEYIFKTLIAYMIYHYDFKMVREGTADIYVSLTAAATKEAQFKIR